MRSTALQAFVLLTLAWPLVAATVTADVHADSPRRRAWLGVQMKLVKDKKPPVVATRVMRTSPAEGAGLRAGDGLAKLDGNAMDTPEQVSAFVGTKQPGDTIEVTFTRGDAEKKTSVKLELFPGAEEAFRRDRIDTFAPVLLGEAVQGSVVPFKGKVTVVEFWATWCVPCRAMAPILNELADKKGAQGLRVVGVTQETVAIATKGVADFGIKYTVIADTEGKTEAGYTPPAMPTAFLVDKKGKIREVLIGFSFDEAERLAQATDKLLAEKEE